MIASTVELPVTVDSPPRTERNGHRARPRLSSARELAANPEIAIEAVQLERRFGDKVAVDGVNLAVARGEIYGFLGPNGAGKSTACRIFCTLTSPTGGKAIVAGFDVQKDAGAVRLHIGAALQATALDVQQTGTELLRQQGRYYGLSASQIEARIAELRKLVDIGEAMDQRIKSYSGGMKRRIDLAAALIHNPEVLFLDEPTTGLDPASRAKVWEEVRRLNRDFGMTIFLTTQYLEEADVLADRVGIIDHGRIVAEGTPASLKRSIGADLVVLEVDEIDRAREIVARIDLVDEVDAHGDELTAATSDGSAAVSPIAVALANAGVRVKSLTLREPTLDDVFLTMTGNRLQEEA